jgi:TRAP-type C4-dicarboxylate transport system permease small subunit
MTSWLDAPIIWSAEAVSHLLIIVLLFSIPECTRQNGHIRMDLLTQRMPRFASRAVEALYALIGIIIFVLIAKKTSGEIGYLRSIPETTEFLHLPIWLYYAGIALLSAIMALMFAIRLMHAVVAPALDAKVGQ